MSTWFGTLEAFVARWYERPIRAGDGVALEEIAAAEARLDIELPGALREWFALVGKRLQMTQDIPQRLEALEVERGSVWVWHENQGVWSICSPVARGSDDPLALIETDDEQTSLDAPLSRVLCSLAMNETLVGAWSGVRAGVFGPLKATVRGGYHGAATEAEIDALRQHYPTLSAAMTVPFFFPDAVGNDATVVRLSDVAVEWMTADDEALEVLSRLVALDPPNGQHLVTFSLDPLGDAADALLNMSTRSFDPAQYDSVLEGVGRLIVARFSAAKDSLSFDIRTRDPERVLEVMLKALDARLLPKLIVRERPESISSARVIYPRKHA